jgi:sulfide:quinone oxidoreductase
MAELKHKVVVVGGGAAGIATTASMLRRRPGLDIAILDGAQDHYYQPGWTMVGGGVFDAPVTRRSMESVIPKGATWIRQNVASFDPDNNCLTTSEGDVVHYDLLIAAPGIKLDWGQIAGLEETLGRNGVTSNYGYNTAPYTWDLVQQTTSGRALFTQPPMPIKCAGAPQKSMYLACDHWRRSGVLENIDVQFRNAGGVLFGVPEYVPALMSYVEKYGIDLELESNLVAIDGPNGVATFASKNGEEQVEFDMIHVVPPQVGPDFIRNSPLAGASGFVDVDQFSLQHTKYANVFGLGDGCSAPNAKTAAAARKQAPVVAVNALEVLDGRQPKVAYDGYGSCPLTVERGKIVLAEFGYGGKLMPSFPTWLVDGTKATRLSWILKADALPWIYWNGMLKGREWLAGPGNMIAQ